jgi:hypothetical protein
MIDPADIELTDIEKGQLCMTTYGGPKKAKHGISSFPRLIKKIIAFKAWERRVITNYDGTPRISVDGGVVELESLEQSQTRCRSYYPDCWPKIVSRIRCKTVLTIFVAYSIVCHWIRPNMAWHVSELRTPKDLSHHMNTAQPNSRLGC